MAVNTTKLITVNTFQDYLVDKDTGDPLSSGTVTCYQDTARTVLKNWYYQSGTPGAYTYIPLDNPLTLSAVGTVQDPNGNDVLPFFYPYDESSSASSPTAQPYYITVVSSDNISQFTRENFPFVPTVNTDGTSVDTGNNLIVNGEFWRNIGTKDVSAETFYTLAPSQHEVFHQPDITFQKDTTDATDTITFTQFASSAYGNTALTGDVTPEYYLNFKCTAAGTDTYKFIQIPIQPQLTSLAGASGSITLQGITVSGNASITVTLYSYYGTGVSTPTQTPTQTVTLSTSWTKSVITFSFPNFLATPTGSPGDDAYYLRIGLPAGALGVCELNLAMPSIYLGDSVPTTFYKTYDQINSIISAPRTGDMRIGMSSFNPYGWVPLNGGSIGNASSNATTRANTDTWPLFSLLWELAKPYDEGTAPSPFSNLIMVLYDSSGTIVSYGSTAIADYNLNRAIQLPTTYGNTIAGTVPKSNLLDTVYTQTVTPSSTGGGKIQFQLTNSSIGIYDGMPITFSSTVALPTGVFANYVYYVTNYSGGFFEIASPYSAFLANSTVGFTDVGSGTITAFMQAPASTTGVSGTVATGAAATTTLSSIFVNMFMKL